MKILVDIGHPAHVHYFKNAVQILSKKGFDFFFVVRERDSTIELIESTGFNYCSRGKGGRGLFNKLLSIPKIDYKIYKIAKKYRPDIFLSFGSPYMAHVAWLMRKPHIAYDDTEHAKYEHMMYMPFTDIILSPSCYMGKLARNQILFNAFMEMHYLHPNYFKADESILNTIGVKKDEKYCIVRLISWDANHDVGQHGMTLDDKREIVHTIEKYCKVFISSEEKLPNDLQKYKLNIHPSQLHNVLNFASLYIGEGSTTASECTILGTPAIYVNTLETGLTNEERDWGLLFQLLKKDEILNKAIEILSNSESDSFFESKKRTMLSNKIDPTALMVWFLENYPESKRVMIKNPNYQNNFK